MGFFETIGNYLKENDFFEMLIRILLAALAGGLIGTEREYHGRAAGLRTHMMVSLGAALTSIIGISLSVLMYETYGVTSDIQRTGAQVMSGVGFLGAGCILLKKGNSRVTGLTTAAGLWATATAGLALGAGFYEGAIITFVLAVLTFTVFHTIEYKAGKHQRRFGLYIEINSDTAVRACIDYITTNLNAYDIQVTAPRSAVNGNVGIEAVIHNDDTKLKPYEVAAEIEKLEYVIFAIESI